jgi:hypothetical protein
MCVRFLCGVAQGDPGKSRKKNPRGRGERKKSRVGVPFLVHHPYKSHIEINVFIVKVVIS